MERTDHATSSEPLADADVQSVDLTLTWRCCSSGGPLGSWMANRRNACRRGPRCSG